MKIFKNINISSNGSLSFCYNLETKLNNKLVNFQKQDDKTFRFNQKIERRVIESKQLYYYKKKYLK